MELSSIRGLGPARLSALRAMGIDSLRDFLFFLPVSYEDRTRITPIADICVGFCLIQGTIAAKPAINFFHGLSRVTTSIQDGTGKIQAVWYNQPWMKQNLHEGQQVLLYGRIAEKQNHYILQNPQNVDALCIQPVYRAIKGIPAKTIHDIMSVCLKSVEEVCHETLPQRIREKHGLLPIADALRISHFPKDMQNLQLARRRLAFEKMLMYQAAIGLLKESHSKGPIMTIPAEMPDAYWKSLMFVPTLAQRRVLDEIAEDMRGQYAMARLVQGDVGCGKTAIAFGAIMLCVQSGWQAAMMAPTEILARQHFVSAKAYFETQGIRVGLLIGNLKPSEKKKAHACIASGEWKIVFGTHALISEGVTYKKLGLVITDEQHRFGVRQRSILQEKGEENGNKPHVLVMSATPIPRTLALILYGDLDISVVDELPPGRKPVRTRLVPESKRVKMYEFLRAEVEKGHQAYVVCPLVEDSDMLEDVRSAQSTFNDLAENELKGLRVGLTWGSQKPVDKQNVLEQFIEGSLDVLISTTVIEVGVNVPNASIMIIENAERFGLSQLHQLRGRVGRGSEESWCFLLAHETEKLRILAQTNDGFLVAQKDLEIRGPGDLMGTQQSGQELNGFLLNGDVRLLEEAVQCMKTLRKFEEYSEERKMIEEEAMAQYAERVRHVALN
ncbi:MAG: ATP-dependent DNA helicase RecG [Clostridiales bacterium]|nr:ATP-dependent DNA helicase RecG [Clostridiales bacterium]